jgi:hypothetical protein
MWPVVDLQQLDDRVHGRTRADHISDLVANGGYRYHQAVQLTARLPRQRTLLSEQLLATLKES